MKASDSERKQAIKQANAIFAFKLKNKKGDEQSWHIDLKKDGEVRKGLGKDPTGKSLLSSETLWKKKLHKSQQKQTIEFLNMLFTFSLLTMWISHFVAL